MSKKTAAKHKESKPRHTTWATIWMVLMGISSILSVFITRSFLTGDYESTPWFLPLAFLVAAAQIIALIGIWFWKKWAVYLLVVAVIVNVIYGVLVTGTLLMTFHVILGPIILAYLLRSQYKYFT